VEEALIRRRPEEAVRAVLEAGGGGVLGESEQWMVFAREELGETLLRCVIVACAEFACEHCTRGFCGCEICAEAEPAGEFARQADPGDIGVAPCGRCNGTALAPIEFFPAPLRLAVAEARVELASRGLLAVAESEAGPPAGAWDRYSELARNRAIFAAAMVFSRRESNGRTNVGSKLESECWRALASAEAQMAGALLEIANSARLICPIISDHHGRGFHSDLVCLLEAEAVRLRSSSELRQSYLRQNPISLPPGK
jgi:hypothetical protein